MSKHALDLKGVSKVYDNGLHALQDMNLSVKQGDFFALLGMNGAGKSTTIGLITSLLRKTTGEIRIFGHDLDSAPEQAKMHIGVVPQEMNIFIFETPWTILINQAGYYGLPRRAVYERIAFLLNELKLWDKKDVPAQELSGGMKRRLMIARALVHNPALLILDEPTAGVDVELRRYIWDFLRTINNNGITVVLTTHYLEEAEHLCNTVAIIDKGRIIENTSMTALLKTLKFSTIVLNTHEPMISQPDLHPLDGEWMDNQTIELRVDLDMHLNDVFHILTTKGVIVDTIRNKVNRLEALFLDRVRHVQ